ncbi:hypothetical protein BDF20DRAFT_844119 [Mycotypha africana]|uniref:uncharacterized protein n=1 Tax=Mycotypha africana TaxID=64632 RepID=UPI002301EA55|nr:uncharacterized protein BDF20DRAFT_844119 [Mycotypha africana]KAI8991329.1 hypothetical protein BDF20DRAFT_844119 [Mycotypha africana]
MEQKEEMKIVQDILPIQLYLTDWHVRVTWIAFMTLFVLWGLAWWVRNAFGGDKSTIAPVATTTTTTTGTVDPTLTNDPNRTGAVTDPEIGGTAGTTTTTGHTKYATAPSWTQNAFNRLNRAHDLLRDLVLMLLSALCINTFARASTRAVMILAWIFVAFAIVYFFVEAGYEHRYLRLVYCCIFYGIALAIVGLAYAQGFY